MSRPIAPALLPLAAAILAGQAQAQTAGGAPSSYRTGYGMSSGELSQPVNVSTRDPSNNRVIVDGVIQTGSDQSLFSRANVLGAHDSYAGVGGIGTATAIGNNLEVSVVGNNNTVIVNATQTNTGTVTARTYLNGQVEFDGGR